MGLIYNNGLKFAVALNPTGNQPLDTRTVVQSLSDLENATKTFGTAWYIGMQVTVLDSCDVYLLIANPTIITGMNCWKKVNSDQYEVSGPTESTPNHIAVFKDNTGKVIKDSGVIVYTQTANFGEAFNNNNSATGEKSHAEGLNTTASGLNSHAEGADTTARDNEAHAEGWASHAIAKQSHAEGQKTEASGQASHAEGINTYAKAAGAHSEGLITDATGQASHAEGNATHATGQASHAEGLNTTASFFGSHAEGMSTTASGQASHAEGLNTQATSGNAHSEGFLTQAKGDSAHSEGRGTIATGNQSHAEGFLTQAKGDSAHSEGTDTKTHANEAHAEGWLSIAAGNQSHAEGRRTFAMGESAHAEGYNDQTPAMPSETTHNAYWTRTVEAYDLESWKTHLYDITLTNAINEINVGEYVRLSNSNTDKPISNIYMVTDVSKDHRRFRLNQEPKSVNLNVGQDIRIYTLGNKSNKFIAAGVGAHTEGHQTIASGDHSHTEGNNTITYGECSHAEGYGGIALMPFTHVEGQNTKANAPGSHAEGSGSLADAYGSHTEGCATWTQGWWAHAEGFKTAAGRIGTAAIGTIINSTEKRFGSTSHSEGKMTWASGMASHAEGNGELIVHLEKIEPEYESEDGFLYKLTIPVKNAEGIIEELFLKNALEDQLIYNLTSDIPVGYITKYERIEPPELSGNPSIIYVYIKAYNTDGLPRDTAAVGEYRINLNLSKSEAGHTEGKNTLSVGMASHAEGYRNLSTDTGSHSEGSFNYSLALSSHSEGRKTMAKGTCSHAEGFLTIAVGNDSHAEGTSRIDMRDYSLYDAGYFNIKWAQSTQRRFTAATGQGAHAEGRDVLAEGDYSHAEGDCSHTKGHGSHAEGADTCATGYASHSEGSYLQAYGSQSHAEGWGERIPDTYNGYSLELASKSDIIKEFKDNDIFSLAYGQNSHVEGCVNIALGDNSHAEGLNNVAEGNRSHAEGDHTHAEGDNSHAEGWKTVALGTASHAEGTDTIAVGNDSHAEGDHTQVPGNVTLYFSQRDAYHGDGVAMSLSIGRTATKEDAINYLSEHEKSIKSGGLKLYVSFLEGNGLRHYGLIKEVNINSSQNQIVVKFDDGYSPSNEKVQTTWSDIYIFNSEYGGSNYMPIGAAHAAHAEGSNTKAYGNYSHAGGYNNVTLNRGELACGKYNESVQGTLFTVGAGHLQSDLTPDRKNAIAVIDTDVYIYGVGGYYGNYTPTCESISTVLSKMPRTQALSLNSENEFSEIVKGPITKTITDSNSMVYSKSDCGFVGKNSLGEYGKLNNLIIKPKIGELYILHNEIQNDIFMGVPGGLHKMEANNF